MAQEATPEAVAPPQALLPADADYGSGQTAEINGVDIYYEVYGEGNGDPVILLHGGLSNGDHFVNIIPALAENHEVIVMDSRGHGRSSFNETLISYEVMANDVLGLMDHLGIDKAEHRRLERWRHHRAGDRHQAPGAAEQGRGLRRQLRSLGCPPGHRAEPGFQCLHRSGGRRSTRSSRPRRSAGTSSWRTSPTCGRREPNYTEEQLKSITTPILVLDGAKEEAIDLNQTKLMALLIPGAELILMPDTGHMALFEQPEEFLQITEDYLAG